jgi:hypothetical protein
MISKSHFITPQNWERNLLIRPMRIIPHAASRSYDKNSYGLNNGIPP